jgi:hypothetical protein
MKNILEKSCRESRNTHFMFSNLFSKTMPFMGYVEKYCRAAGQATSDYGANLLHDGYLGLQIYTQVV